jgi:hypothetical protein
MDLVEGIVTVPESTIRRTGMTKLTSLEPTALADLIMVILGSLFLFENSMRSLSASDFDFW